ncbi:MAG: SDR family oxidoreductase [Gemmatimonadaceae bacterium]|nr:SDR family oxidoreductase [Gemmatimonadaceae bacterium]
MSWQRYGAMDLPCPSGSRAAVLRLHERGASVAINACDAERARGLADAFGERGLAAPGDIAEDGVPEELVRLTLARFGRVDILVNNAATARSARFGDLKSEEWRQTYGSDPQRPIPDDEGRVVLTHEHATSDLLDRLAAGYPVPRLGTAREVADLICFAASEAAGYITGASFDINGGDLMM